MVVVLRSPEEEDGCCCVHWVAQMTTSGKPEHKQEVGCPPGLGRTSGHQEPPRGRMVDGNLSPACPFTACFNALALRECLGCVCVFPLLPQHCGSPSTGPSGLSAKASHSVSRSERRCGVCAAEYGGDSIVSSLVNFVSPPPLQTPPPPLHSVWLPTKM